MCFLFKVFQQNLVACIKCVLHVYQLKCACCGKSAVSGRCSFQTTRTRGQGGRRNGTLLVFVFKQMTHFLTGCWLHIELVLRQNLPGPNPRRT